MQRHPASPPGSRPEASVSPGVGVGVAAAALTIGGWLLLLVSVPVAIFLTWWGDCAADTCPSASVLDRAAYLFDFAAWLVLPALAFGTYRGWRPAAIGLLVIGLVVTGQVVAAILGARGFQAFAIVLPAGALTAAAGIIGLRPALGSGADDRATTRTGLIGLVIVSLVVVAIAFQGVLAGGVGVGQGLLVLIAASLSVITVLALINRGRRPPPADPRRRG
jgi:hypothetical protein